jgi:hypothetical protein
MTSGCFNISDRCYNAKSYAVERYPRRWSYPCSISTVTVFDPQSFAVNLRDALCALNLVKKK